MEAVPLSTDFSHSASSGSTCIIINNSFSLGTANFLEGIVSFDPFFSIRLIKSWMILKKNQTHCTERNLNLCIWEAKAPMQDRQIALACYEEGEGTDERQTSRTGML